MLMCFFFFSGQFLLNSQMEHFQVFFSVSPLFNALRQLQTDCLPKLEVPQEAINLILEPLLYSIIKFLISISLQLYLT